MPRPPQPILSQDSIVDAALRIMDRDGFAAFSLPKLGDELGVRTPSLYYHFRDRAELLAAVARGIVRSTDLPRVGTEVRWQDWFVELSVNFRRAVLNHRRAAPVLLQFLPRDIMTNLYENAAVMVARSGQVDPARHVLLLDGLERLTMGTIVVEALREADQAGAFGGVDGEDHPRLAAAVRANPWDAEDLFRREAEAFVRGVADAAA